MPLGQQDAQVTGGESQEPKQTGLVKIEAIAVFL
jgi:hypothetical protein